MNKIDDNKPLISVVTATYNLVSQNRMQYLIKNIESVHRQTYANIEHIIVDGGSSDGTLDAIEEYVDLGWIKCYSEPDTGIYDAFNKGIKYSNGKYVIFLNSDDFWSEADGVEVAVNVLEHTQADFCYGCNLRVGEYDKVLAFDSPCIGMFFSTMPFCHQTMFTRKDVLEELGGFDMSYRIIADYDLLTRALLAGKKPVFVPYNFTAFRAGGLSTKPETWELNLQERKQLRDKIWKPFLGANADKLIEAELPAEFDKFIIHMVHPSVAIDFMRCIERDDYGRIYVVRNFARYTLSERKWKYTGIVNNKRKSMFSNIPATLNNIQSQSRRDLCILSNQSHFKRKYIRYYLLSKLTFGKTRRHYKSKRNYYSNILKHASTLSRTVK